MIENTKLKKTNIIKKQTKNVESLVATNNKYKFKIGRDGPIKNIA